jgi:hypothetical protein
VDEFVAKPELGKELRLEAWNRTRDLSVLNFRVTGMQQQSSSESPFVLVKKFRALSKDLPLVRTTWGQYCKTKYLICGYYSIFLPRNWKTDGDFDLKYVLPFYAKREIG